MTPAELSAQFAASEAWRYWKRCVRCAEEKAAVAAAFSEAAAQAAELAKAAQDDVDAAKAAWQEAACCAIAAARDGAEEEGGLE